ncbi:hypothetical protein ALT717_170070 [Alteromonas macleodii]
MTNEKQILNLFLLHQRRLIWVFLALCCFESNAVVMRHDVFAEKYRVEKMPEYIVDMPGEGPRSSHRRAVGCYCRT